MRILVTYGSKRGGTEGIAQTVAQTLEEAGYAVNLRPAREVPVLQGYDAVIVGGSLYANRWHRDAAAFVRDNTRELRHIPTWFFSSGPLDDSAEDGHIAPVRQVAALMRRVGAQGHVTFGGALSSEARGFLASALAKQHHGDFRNLTRVQAWTRGVAVELPGARPQPHEETGPAALVRIVFLAFAAWALSTAVAVASTLWAPSMAYLFHAFAVPPLFLGAAVLFFMSESRYHPLTVALFFTASLAALDAAFLARPPFFPSLLGYVERPSSWLVLGSVGLLTWLVGTVQEVKGPRGTRAPLQTPPTPQPTR